MIDHLTAHGVMEPARLYESPFTDVTPQGPEGIFEATELDELVRSLEASAWRHARCSAMAL